MAYLKLILFALIVSGYFISALPFFVLGYFNRYLAIRKLTLIAHLWAKIALKLFAIKVIRNDTEIKSKKEAIGRLIVANHLSYLDAIILLARGPKSFVTSIEMKTTPFLGQICQAAGCLYVERRSRAHLSSEIKDITKALAAGIDVVVFPEATSTNGESIKNFKRPLFAAAIESGATIIPLTLNYRKINSLPVTTLNRDLAFWYADMSFLPHLISVFSQSEFIVEVTSSEFIETEPSDDITNLALLSRERILENYHPIQ
ncbi:putative acyltransferase [Halobacteriovorax marinus SJ]|uniref:Acyltransferase n=1 Tax=Halobacteriovorax marinus (strain ATCC BAA-682 / DSM 15412 / SJ) TaxID=862908 RepID=E1WX40_HALMS|nr:lysophospholipid acyltransferase family protein [Halobacteriovorax marinus]CBW25741.1 putative acyltransferase [Halobacteriovorax marinus SJ]